MKADLSRSSFDPLKHFSAVLMQQGRVQLDADWNEHVAIVHHQLRSLVKDAFPDGVGTGFTIAALDTAKPGVSDDVAIGVGNFWVDGILCELESTPVAVLDASVDKTITVAAWTVDGVAFAKHQYVQVLGDTSSSAPPARTSITAKITALDYPTTTLTLDTSLPAKLRKANNLRMHRVVTYASQPGLPQPPPLESGKSYQLYLDVWEQLVTSLQDDSIREAALNGPDNAARTQVVWQLRARPANRCMTAHELNALLDPVNVGLMRAQTRAGQVSTDPCTISPDSQYRGSENQLYRVEIHAGSPTACSEGAVTFKWSRENGSVVYPITKLATTLAAGITKVTLGKFGRADRFGLKNGDFVEIEDDRSALANTAGPLLHVVSIERSSMIVTLGGINPGSVGTDPTLHPRLRRWDQKAGDPAVAGLELRAGAALLVADCWLHLEDGVQVQFPNAGKASYRTGDYWLIPARVATGTVIWPTETWTDAQGVVTTNPVAKPPDGVEHHYAPVAIVAVNTSKRVPTVTTCRKSLHTR